VKRAAVLLVAAALLACGKKGPPLPPLVLVPVAPAEFAAERRGNAVDLRFVVPRENVDGTRPADVVRVDVFALTTTASPGDGAVAASNEQVIEQGVRIGSVTIRPPADEDEAPPPQPVTDVAVEPEGVDQGATAHVAEDLTADLVAATDSEAVPVRTYVAVAVSARDRRSPFSQRATIPLGPAPAPPAQPSLSYDATTVTVEWPVSAASAEAASFHVYEVAPAVEAGGPRQPNRLTDKPVAGPTFADQRVEWGVERCYTVSAVRTIGGFSVESEAAETRCITFTDTFAPQPPAGVTAVATQGAISLIWQAAAEPDVAGYVVLRGAEGGPLEPITPQPIQATSFRDEVPSGTRYRYAVRAVDTAGNASEPSPPIEEMSR
jgi:predicted small lipoprotein YifL